MRWHQKFAALSCIGMMGAAGTVVNADPPTLGKAPGTRSEAATRTTDEATPPAGKVAVDPDGKILAAKTFRSSKLVGMNVRNRQGETLGSIDDFVVDLRTGKIQYAAMSVGGVLGIGDKLLAVPFSELKFDHGQDEMFFVLDLSKDKVESAPGFNKSDWPDMADPEWSRKIDEHYRKAEVRTGDAVRPQETVAPRVDGVRAND